MNAAHNHFKHVNVPSGDSMAALAASVGAL